MDTYRVWAPLPKKVELQIGKKRFPMTRGDDGWWTATPAPVSRRRDRLHATGTAAVPGDYGFVLDGKGPFPDPRSPWQPNGIYGLSRPVDHSRFRWTDA